MTAQQGSPIRVVARRTGLTTHVIRIWERRYGAVRPLRTPTNRRLYTEADIERLSLLRRATLAGHNIGQIAQLDTAELLRILHEDGGAARPGGPSEREAIRDRSPQSVLDECLAAAEALNSQALELALERASVVLSKPALLEQVISPLLEKIGERWQEGSLRVAHEHFAVQVVRSFLGTLSGAFRVDANAPLLVVTTPSGQWHEFGALLAAATAASHGWRVLYLGPSLPAEDIAAAVRQSRARALALSIVYPQDDPRLVPELRRLRRVLPQEVAVLVGGRAAPAYANVLGHIGAPVLPDLSSLRAALGSLRSRGAD